MVLVEHCNFVALLVQWYIGNSTSLSFRVRAPLVAGFAPILDAFSNREFFLNFSRTVKLWFSAPVSSVLEWSQLSEKHHFNIAYGPRFRDRVRARGILFGREILRNRGGALPAPIVATASAGLHEATATHPDNFGRPLEAPILLVLYFIVKVHCNKNCEI